VFAQKGGFQNKYSNNAHVSQLLHYKAGLLQNGYLSQGLPGLNNVGQ
jgi:hypothetical protein